MLSTWELFREELDRNTSPNLSMIEEQLSFLIDRGVCEPSDFSKVTKVRLMASHEQAISEYLHTRGIYRQASLKAETIYLASTIEYLLALLLEYLLKIKYLTQDDINNVFPKKTKFKTFAKLIECTRYFPEFPIDLKKSIDEMRKERNLVHIDAYCLDDTKIFHEEYQVVKFRRVFDDFIKYINIRTRN